MAENGQPYDQVDPNEIVIVGDKTEKVSLEGRWLGMEAKRYDIAGWLAKGLFWVFAGIIALSAILFFILVYRGGVDPETNLVAGFIKDLMPFIATPLGVALGFFFREASAGQYSG